MELEMSSIVTGLFMAHSLITVKRLSVKLWTMSSRATQDGRVRVKSTDKPWSVHWRRERQPTPVPVPGDPLDSMKRQKDMTPEDEPPILEGVQHATREEQRASLSITPETAKWLGRRGNKAWLWTCLVVRAKSDAAKNSTAQEPGMLGPWIKVNWMWSSRRWQEWTWTS